MTKEQLLAAIAAPGLYIVATRRELIVIETDADGVQHELKPASLRRDGVLAPDGWSDREDLIVVGPFGRLVPEPIDMVLHCPKCGEQHIDAPDWHNDPHLGAVRLANDEQGAHTAGDGITKQPKDESLSLLVRKGGVAAGRHAEQAIQDVCLPSGAIHETDENVHLLQVGDGGVDVLSGQQNRQPTAEVQGLSQDRDGRMKAVQPDGCEGRGEAAQQGAARDAAIRVDARAVSGAPESGRGDLQHMREGRAAEAQEGAAITGPLPCNRQNPGGAVLTLQHDAGLRERRLDAPEERDPVSGEAPLRAPSHRSHLCRPEDGGCGHIWRPADVPTNGVAAVKTKGKRDDEPLGRNCLADRFKERADLLNEVRENFTRDDDLPNGLLSRIDDAIGEQT